MSNFEFLEKINDTDLRDKSSLFSSFDKFDNLNAVRKRFFILVVVIVDVVLKGIPR